MKSDKKISCIIVDDEPLARKGLESYIEDIDFLSFAGAAKNISEAEAILSDNHIELMFLDIEMPGISGIDFLKAYKQRPKTILTTAYSDYALLGYELDVLDYLVKPISFSRFYQACTKAKQVLDPMNHIGEEEHQDYFFVKDSKKYRPVVFHEILYIESLQNYIVIHCVNGKVIVYMTLKEVERNLPSNGFVQIHKSYIINLRHISHLTRDEAVIHDMIIPIGRVFSEHLFNTVIGKKLLRKNTP